MGRLAEIQEEIDELLDEAIRKVRDKQKTHPRLDKSWYDVIHNQLFDQFEKVILAIEGEGDTIPSLIKYASKVDFEALKADVESEAKDFESLFNEMREYCDFDDIRDTIDRVAFLTSIVK